MKGSVRKKRKNAWSYRIDLGTVDGKRKQVEKGGFKTEREATKAMQDVLYHLNNTGDYVENKKISFHTVYEEFIEREGKATRAYSFYHPVDVLYAVARMGRLTGLELAENMRSRYPSLRVFILWHNDAFRQEAEQLEVDGYLITPVTADAPKKRGRMRNNGTDHFEKDLLRKVK